MNTRTAQLGSALLLATALLISPGRAQATAQHAAGGVRLLELMESAPVTAVGLVRAPRRLDRRAFAAQLDIESLLIAPTPFAKAVRMGRAPTIAWEERVPERSVRFADGDRILLVLEPLPGDSIWIARLPDPVKRQQTLHVAARGDAFLRQPALGTVSLLEHYLALSPADRRDGRGVALLVDLVRSAALPLAENAVVVLGRIATLNDRLAPATADHLVAALLRPDANEALRVALLTLIEDRQLESLRPPLDSKVREAARRPGPDGSPALAAPLVYAALARLSADFSPSTSRRLAAESDPTYRLAAIRAAGEDEAWDRLRRLARDDPAPRVRAAAIARLARIDAKDAMPTALALLGDSDPQVRDAAAMAIARLGPPAIPELVAVVDAGPRDATIAATRALREIQPAGVVALRLIAADHPDTTARNAARLMLGMEIGGAH